MDSLVFGLKGEGELAWCLCLWCSSFSLKICEEPDGGRDASLFRDLEFLFYLIFFKAILF